VKDRPPVEDILSLACRAPSVHNSQPWRWRAEGDRIDLFADYRRQLVYADPARRDLMMSCGAALHHLQVAAAGLGWRARSPQGSGAELSQPPPKAQWQKVCQSPRYHCRCYTQEPPGESLSLQPQVVISFDDTYSPQ